MQQGKSEKIWLTLDAETWSQVVELKRVLGIESTPEVMRIIVRQAIAAVPWDSPILLAANEAIRETRHWAFERMREKFAEIEQELNVGR